MITEKQILNLRIGVVANDAGGSNYIYSFIKHHSISPFLYCNGPAEDIFSKLENSVVCLSIDEVISNVDIIIFASGQTSGFEIENLKYSKNKVLTASVLDHWTNYTNRFKLNNESILPDIFIVYDKNAYDLCTSQFPEFKNIILLKNYYLENQLIESNTLEIKKDYILYLDEPIKFHPNSIKKYNYDEILGFELFLKFKNKTKFKNDKILIRFHPSELNKSKYDVLINSYKGITITNHNSLVEDLTRSKIVVGYESMAMVVALQINKPVFSIIPPNGTKSSLPFDQIKSFFDEV
jgi:hypothetical protein